MALFKALKYSTHEKKTYMDGNYRPTLPLNPLGEPIPRLLYKH